MDGISLSLSPSLPLSQRHNFTMQIHVWFQKNLSLDLNSTPRSQTTGGKNPSFFHYRLFLECKDYFTTYSVATSILHMFNRQSLDVCLFAYHTFVKGQTETKQIMYVYQGPQSRPQRDYNHTPTQFKRNNKNVPSGKGNPQVIISCYQLLRFLYHLSTLLYQRNNFSSDSYTDSKLQILSFILILPLCNTLSIR